MEDDRLAIGTVAKLKLKGRTPHRTHRREQVLGIRPPSPLDCI